MIQYYQNLQNTNYLKVDTESLTATMIVIKGTLKVKSDVINPDSYQAILEEVGINLDFWTTSDEATFNEKLALIP